MFQIKQSRNVKTAVVDGGRGTKRLRTAGMLEWLHYLSLGNAMTLFFRRAQRTQCSTQVKNDTLERSCWVSVSETMALIRA